MVSWIPVCYFYIDNVSVGIFSSCVVAAYESRNRQCRQTKETWPVMAGFRPPCVSAGGGPVMCSHCRGAYFARRWEKGLIHEDKTVTVSIKIVAFVYINWKFNFPFIYSKDWKFYVNAHINYESEG